MNRGFSERKEETGNKTIQLTMSTLTKGVKEVKDDDTKIVQCTECWLGFSLHTCENYNNLRTTMQ